MLVHETTIDRQSEATGARSPSIDRERITVDSDVGEIVCNDGSRQNRSSAGYAVEELSDPMPRDADSQRKRQAYLKNRKTTFIADREGKMVAAQLANENALGDADSLGDNVLDEHLDKHDYNDPDTAQGLGNNNGILQVN